MAFPKGCIIFLTLFLSNKVFSTTLESTVKPVNNATDTEKSTSSNSNTTLPTNLGNSSIQVTNTKENFTNSVTNTTVAQLNNTSSTSENDEITTEHDTLYDYMNSREEFNYSLYEKYMNLKPTNESMYRYTLVPVSSNNSNNSKIDTEVSDMLNVPKPSTDYDQSSTEPKIKYNPEDPVDTRIFLLDDTINTNLEGSSRRLSTQHEKLNHIELVPGQLAAILAGVFVGISIIGYIALLSWRRYLENRYGNREMLVDDDFCEKQMSDLEHFSI